MKRTLLFIFVVMVSVQLVSAHIRINPTESTAGAREKYTMRVPNEKQVASSRIEGEFPAGLDVYDFEFKPGWTITFKKDDKGKDHRSDVGRQDTALRVCRVRNARDQSEGSNEPRLEIHSVLRQRHKGRIHRTRRRQGSIASSARCDIEAGSHAIVSLALELFDSETRCRNLNETRVAAV